MIARYLRAINGSPGLKGSVLGIGVLLLIVASVRSRTNSRMVPGNEGSEQSAASRTGIRHAITVACVSDTHGLHHSRPHLLKVPKADILVFAGDAGLSSDRHAKQLNTWLAAQDAEHKIVTYGNMDFWGDDHTEGNQELLPAAHVVVDRIVEVAGWRVFASPCTPAFEGVFQLETQEEATKLWSRLLPPDERVDILVTHGPPFGIGDLTKGRHVGDKALLKAVQALKQPPLLWVCGHVHASNGQYSVPHPGGDILLINAASYNLMDGNPQAAPRLVELPSRRVTQAPLE